MIRCFIKMKNLLILICCNLFSTRNCKCPGLLPLLEHQRFSMQWMIRHDLDYNWEDPLLPCGPSFSKCWYVSPGDHPQYPQIRWCGWQTYPVWIFWSLDILRIGRWHHSGGPTQPAITCLKLTIETLEQGTKYIQS